MRAGMVYGEARRVGQPCGRSGGPAASRAALQDALLQAERYYQKKARQILEWSHMLDQKKPTAAALGYHNFPDEKLAECFEQALDTDVRNLLSISSFYCYSFHVDWEIVRK